MAKLYEISERYKNLENLLDNPDIKNFKQDLDRSLNEIDEEFNVKVENIAKLIKSTEADIGGIDGEIKRLQQRKKTYGNMVANLKAYIFDQMVALKKKSIKGNLFTLTVRKNPPTVNIMDEDIIPEKYKIPQPYKLDKKAMLADLKQDIEIDGADIKQNTGLQIR
jgi:predicted DNA-binding protein YlxM (UPF0122 family)